MLILKRKIDISILLLLLTVTVTIFLFFFLSKEESRSSEFVFNLGYALFLEIMFYAFIFTTRLNSKKVLGATYSVLGAILVYYLIFGIITLLIFNIFLLELISARWYYSVVIIGTLATIIVTGFVYKLNNSIVTKEEGAETFGSSHSSILQEIQYLESTYKSTISKKGLSESFESNYGSLLEKVSNKLQYINPKVFEDSNVHSRLKEQISLIEGHVQELKKPDSDREILLKQIHDIVDDTISYMDTLK